MRISGRKSSGRSCINSTKEIVANGHLSVTQEEDHDIESDYAHCHNRKSPARRGLLSAYRHENALTSVLLFPVLSGVEDTVWE